VPEGNTKLPVLLLLAMTGPNVVLAGDSLRDPTRPYSRAVDTREFIPTFELQAIFRSADRRLAVVNGQRVAVGDRVDGATVVAIGPDSLSLDFRGKHLTTELLDGVKK